MLVYWILLALPALAALVMPARPWPGFNTQGSLSLGLLFILVYTVLASIRFEIGSDWYAYQEMYGAAKNSSFINTFWISDPLFCVLLWIAAVIDGGIYLVNGVCALILVTGVMRVAAMTREPWLAVAAAVPYLLIVVGFGYVRQGAAIGFILWAVGTMDSPHKLRTAGLLILALGFHLSSLVVFPIFAFALANKNKLAILSMAPASIFILAIIAARQSDHLDAHYFGQNVESSGAFVRVLMGFAPALLVLFRWPMVDSPYRVRMIWLGVALANVGSLVALGISPSSTAVDRAALYFSPIQIFAFGEWRRLTQLSDRNILLVRILALGLIAAVMLVWLKFATHASDWVPYETFWMRP